MDGETCTLSLYAISAAESAVVTFLLDLIVTPLITGEEHDLKTTALVALIVGTLHGTLTVAAKCAFH